MFTKFPKWLEQALIEKAKSEGISVSALLIRLAKEEVKSN